MFDMMKMLGKMKEVQARMKETQEKLGHLSTEAEAGAGLVTAKVNGHRQVTAITIDPSIIDPTQPEVLQDLVVAAVNMAMEKIDEQIKEELKNNTDGILPDIPGLDLNLG